MTRSLDELDWRVILLGLIGALVAVLMSYGCMVVDPGGQAARSLKQWSEVTWTESGALVRPQAAKAAESEK